MMRSQKRQGYAIAALASVVVLFLRYTMMDVLGEQAHLMPFLIVVMAAAWWGGMGPGLLATALSLIGGVYYIVPPPFSMRIETVEHGLNAIIFVVIGVTISLLCEALHAAHRRDTEKQFRTLADSIPQLAWMARPDGHRFWFNKRWHEYTGATAAEMERDGWIRIHDPEQRDQVLAHWRSAVASGTPWQETVKLRRHDGTMHWHLCQALPLRDEQGEIVRWFGTNTDISEHMALEEALKDADRRKDEFLATLAHELRNPLGPIRNVLELWPLSEGDRAEMAQLRAIMDRQLQQLIRLIDDLMDVSRITRGKIQLQRRPVDLGGAVSRAIETVRFQIDAAKDRLVVKLPAEPIFVNGDLARLTQVFGNLLHNAVKFSPNGGPIGITAERRGDRAVVSVRDNGQGIPQSMLGEIFEIFRQVDPSLDRASGGLGIGLTLVKQLVDLHGGTVEARSEGTGTGSEFIVTLPALVQKPDNAEPPEGRRARRRKTGLPRRRILVVDDIEDAAQTMAMMLRSMGQEVTVLNHPQAAVDWILANRPDIVFLDIAMPHMNGYDVARQLVAHPELEHTCLVAVTGYGQKQDRDAAFQAGFNSHITKPADIQHLEDLLLTLPIGPAQIEVATR